MINGYLINIFFSSSVPCSIDILSALALTFQARLPPEVNRILFVKNLPYDITGEEMYEIFGKFGPLRQVRLYVSLRCPIVPYSLTIFSGNRKDTKGTAFVVYEDIYDAKNAREHLSGFNVKDRYLIVLYHNPVRRCNV